MSFPFERRVYRIEYPEGARPQFTISSGVVPVVDCSEDGLRYRSVDNTYPAVGSVVEGRVRFRGSPAEVTARGKVVRCQNGEVALHLEQPGIPRAVLFSEQRFLRARYPTRGRGA